MFYIFILLNLLYLLKRKRNKSCIESTILINISNFRLAVFKSSLNKLFQERRIQNILKTEVIDHLNTTLSLNFTSDEINAAISTMTDANQIMAVEDHIFLI